MAVVGVVDVVVGVGVVEGMQMERRAKVTRGKGRRQRRQRIGCF